MNRSTISLPSIVFGLVFGTLAVIVVAAFADGDPTTDEVPRVIPYQGTIELDGRPVNAIGENALPLRFSLFDGVESTTPVYVQDVNVEVFAGRFTATIGPVGADGSDGEVFIADVVAAADDLYIGITLLNDADDPEDDVALSNRQRIHATPYAMWATSSTNLNVSRDLVVGRDARIGGSLAVTGDAVAESDLTVNGALNVGGTATADGLNVTNNVTVEGTTTLDALHVEGGLQAETGPVRVFGEWSTNFEFNTTYTAPADGFVVAFAYRNSRNAHVRLTAYTPATVERLRDFNRTESGDNAVSITMPVREGDTWRVNLGGIPTSTRISYLRLGN